VVPVDDERHARPPSAACPRARGRRRRAVLAWPAPHGRTSRPAARKPRSPQHRARAALRAHAPRDRRPPPRRRGR
jgi:hypothetical protein